VIGSARRDQCPAFRGAAAGVPGGGGAITGGAGQGRLLLAVADQRAGDGDKGTREDTIAVIDGAVGAKGKLVIIWPAASSGGQTVESLAGLESEAVKISDWEPYIIPGLAQTPDYSRAVTRAGRPRASEAEIADLAEKRIARQAIFAGTEAPMMSFAIDESALLRPFGGKAAMRDQLLALEEMAMRPGIIIQVMPFTATEHPGHAGPLRIMEFPGKSPAWYSEGWNSGRMADAKNEVFLAMIHFDLIRASALSPAQSVELMSSVRNSRHE
jgi:hypothetical protein